MQDIDFVESLKEADDHIQQELFGFLLGESDYRIGDFGCGTGYETLSLMLNFDAIDCIGIDKVNEWQIPSIQSAKDTLRLGSNLPTDLRAKTQQSLDRGYWPIFQQADVLDKNNFPKNRV